MKIFKQTALAGALALVLGFTAAPAIVPDAATVAEATKAEGNPSLAVDVNFKSGKTPQGFYEADGWTNGNPFNVNWKKDNVRFNNGKMQLIVDDDFESKNDRPYSGGEIRTEGFYGYGRYETRMKACRNDGTVWSFFTYTGPYEPVPDPWDEIDIEILGKDTTKVQFNYFRDGKGGHEYMYDLGFDAAEDFHTYAFEWHKDKIVWYVDGKEAHRVEGANIPVTKMRIMANAWAGIGVNDWLKAFDDSNLPIQAEYEYIKYTPSQD